MVCGIHACGVFVHRRAQACPSTAAVCCTQGTLIMCSTFLALTVSGELPHVAIYCWSQTYIALARVDPDAAWCQLTAASLATGRHAVGGIAIEGDVPCAPAPRPTTSEGTPLVFPEQCHILPPLPTQSGVPAEAALRHQRGAAKSGVGLVVPAGLVECSAAKLSAILHEVEKMPLPWHAHISA